MANEAINIYFYFSLVPHLQSDAGLKRAKVRAAAAVFVLANRYTPDDPNRQDARTQAPRHAYARTRTHASTNTVLLLRQRKQSGTASRSPMPA